MGKIPEHLIEEIRNKVSVSDVVSQYVTLTSRGGRLWGLCPFHNEKTPSFTVNDDKGFYHCFGCGKGGSIFNFLMDIEQYSFLESVKFLAEKAGVQLSEESEEDKERRSLRNDLFELNQKLKESFHYILLNSSKASAARNYLQRRKVAQETIETFKIGYAPADPRWLYGFLSSKGYSDELLTASGLFSKQKKGLALFRDRVIFPILDTRGQTIAFGGRALSELARAKYLNSPETPIFHKREHLFGLYQGLDSVKKSEEIIICEGYFDVAALHQAGIHNAAAPLGTSFTEQQAERIRRYAHTCLLFFDNDAAGKQAAQKTLLILEKAGLSGEVIENRESKDAADLIESGKEELLKEILKNSVNGFNYLVQNAINTYDINLPDGKLSVFKEVEPYIQSVESEIKKQSMIKTLSDVLNLDDSVFFREMNRRSTPVPYTSVQHDQSETENQEPFRSSILSPDLYLMLTIVNNRKYFQRVRQKISLAKIEDACAADIYTALEESFREGETSFEYLLARLELSKSKRFVESAFGMEEFNTDAERIVKDAERTILLRDLSVKQRRVEQQLKSSAIQGINEQELTELLYEKKFIDEEIHNLRNPNGSN